MHLCTPPGPDSRGPQSRSQFQSERLAGSIVRPAPLSLKSWSQRSTRYEERKSISIPRWSLEASCPFSGQVSEELSLQTGPEDTMSAPLCGQLRSSHVTLDQWWLLLGEQCRQLDQETHITGSTSGSFPWRRQGQGRGREPGRFQRT